MSNLPPGCTDADVDLSRGRYYQEGYEAAEAGRGEGRCPFIGGLACRWLDGWEAWHAEHDAAEQEGEA